MIYILKGCCTGFVIVFSSPFRFCFPRHPYIEFYSGYFYSILAYLQGVLTVESFGFSCQLKCSLYCASCLARDFFPFFFLRFFFNMLLCIRYLCLPLVGIPNVKNQKLSCLRNFEYSLLLYSNYIREMKST